MKLNLRFTHRALALAALSVFIGGGCLHATAIRSGFDTQAGGRNDDGGYPCGSPSAGAGCSGTAVPIGFGIDFFGQTFFSVFVNNNGNLTFTSPLATFTPFGLSSDIGTPIIAPFFADVDTRVSGSPVAIGTGTVDGASAFGATWRDVDYYNGNAQHAVSNTFQVVLIDRSQVGAGDFDIEFNYGQIQWETGDASGGSGGLGGNSARVGFSAGTGVAGSYYELAGSGVPGSFLDANSSGGLVGGSLNSGVAGRYVLDVRNGALATAPEPASSATLALGIALLALGSLRRSGGRTWGRSR